MKCPRAIWFEGRSKPQADACLARDGQGYAAETGNQHFVILRRIRVHSRDQSEPVACGRGGAGVQARLKSRTRTKPIPAVTAGTREACRRPADLRTIANLTSQHQPSVCIRANLWLNTALPFPLLLWLAFGFELKLSGTFSRHLPCPPALHHLYGPRRPLRLEEPGFPPSRE